MPPKKNTGPGGISEADEIVLWEKKIKEIEQELAIAQQRLNTIREEARLRTEMEERIRKEQAEAKLRSEIEERIRSEAQMRMEIEERIRSEAQMRMEIEERIRSEARIKTEIEERIRKETVEVLPVVLTEEKKPSLTGLTGLTGLTAFQALKTKFTKEATGWVILEKVYEAFADVLPSMSREEIVKFLQTKGYTKTAKTVLEKQRYGIAGLTLVDSDDTVSNASTKRKTIPKAVKITLWNKYFGEDHAKGTCNVCQREIKMTEFDAGHIVAVANGGSDNLDNLAPVCGTCNKSMGTQNLQEFKTVYFLPSTSTTPSPLVDLLQ